MLRVACCSCWLGLLAAIAGCGSGKDRCSDVVLAPHNCNQSGCIGESWSSSKAEFGQSCQKGEDCQSGLCASDSVEGTKYCTQTCDAKAATAACPKGAGCFTAEGGMAVCGPVGSATEPPCS